MNDVKSKVKVTNLEIFIDSGKDSIRLIKSKDKKYVILHIHTKSPHEACSFFDNENKIFKKENIGMVNLYIPIEKDLLKESLGELVKWL